MAAIGSALSTRYRDDLWAMMVGQHVPAVVAHRALSSIGGAIDIATTLPAAAGTELVAAAGSAFMSAVGLPSRPMALRTPSPSASAGFGKSAATIRVLPDSVVGQVR